MSVQTIVESNTPVTEIKASQPSLVSELIPSILPGMDSIEYSFGLFPGLQKVIKCGPALPRQIGQFLCGVRTLQPQVTNTELGLYILVPVIFQPYRNQKRNLVSRRQERKWIS